MRIGMTMMVRDEADIIKATVGHAIAMGVDRLIVTDNGSVDGTTEILEHLASQGVLELLHEPEHRKQQSSTVSAMARELAAGDAVDWVINADADEFLVVTKGPEDLREAFAGIPAEVEAFQVPVVNMVGPLVKSGWNPRESRWRDNRSASQLEAVGLRAHPTPNAIHRARNDVVVAQGNHFVSIPGSALPRGLAFEVLHFPWRSWSQYARRVKASGLAYLANTERRPSPNHHGMLDYTRLEENLLLAYFSARHPLPGELSEHHGFQEYPRIAELFVDTAAYDTVGYDADVSRGLAMAGRRLVADELRTFAAVATFAEMRQLHIEELNAANRLLGGLAHEFAGAREELHRARTGRIYRAAHSITTLLGR